MSNLGQALPAGECFSFSGVQCKGSEACKARFAGQDQACNKACPVQRGLGQVQCWNNMTCATLRIPYVVSQSE